EKDVDSLEGTAQQSPGLRTMLAEQVPAEAAAWFAADSARWTEKKPVAALLAVSGWKKEGIDMLAKGRAGIVAVTLADPPRLRLAVACDNSESSEKLRAYFQGRASAKASTPGGSGEWATLEIPADPQAAFQSIKGMLDDAGR